MRRGAKQKQGRSLGATDGVKNGMRTGKECDEEFPRQNFQILVVMMNAVFLLLVVVVVLGMQMGISIPMSMRC